MLPNDGSTTVGVLSSRAESGRLFSRTLLPTIGWFLCSARSVVYNELSELRCERTILASLVILPGEAGGVEVSEFLTLKPFVSVVLPWSNGSDLPLTVPAKFVGTLKGISVLLKVL